MSSLQFSTHFQMKVYRQFPTPSFVQPAEPEMKYYVVSHSAVEYLDEPSESGMSCTCFTSKGFLALSKSDCTVAQNKKKGQLRKLCRQRDKKDVLIPSSAPFSHGARKQPNLVQHCTLETMQVSKFKRYPTTSQVFCFN